MSASALIGLRPTSRRRFCSQSGDGPLRTLRISRPANLRMALGSPGAKLCGSGAMGLGPLLGTGLMSVGFSVPMPESGKIAGYAIDAGRVATIGGDGDVDDRAAEIGIVDVARADGRIVGQLDDAVMIVAQLVGSKAAYPSEQPRITTPSFSVKSLPGI